MLKFLHNRLSTTWRRRPVSTDGVFVDVTSTASLSAEVADLRQGDIVDVKSLPLKWDRPGELACDEGVVLISQTCDLVRNHRAEAQVAPLVRLGADEASQARSGRLPRYVPVSTLGPNYFADLSFIATVHKNHLIGKVRSHGLDQSSHQQISAFSQAVGRRFSRFAFPDEVTPWIKPLQDILRSKAPKARSPLHLPLQYIVELRLEAIRGWTAEPPYDLVLLVILAPGVLPEFDDEAGAAQNKYEPTVKTIPEIAMTMPKDGAPAIDKLHFWEEFGDALARHCRPADGAPVEIKEAVRSISAEVLSEEDLSYARVRRSAEIDLDHLSEPEPI